LLLCRSELNNHRNKIDGTDLQQMAVTGIQQAERAMGFARQLAQPAHQPVALLAAPPESLTTRECQVVELISKGNSQKGAALLSNPLRNLSRRRDAQTFVWSWFFRTVETGVNPLK
jgi:hypothetical protein